MTTATPSIASAGASRENAVYIVGPVFDILFICGGSTVLLTCLASLQGTDAPAVAALLFAGTYLLAQPHLGATLIRLYGSKESMSSHKFVAFDLPCFMVLALGWLFFNLSPTAVMDLLTSIYLLFIGHHVLAQCYGIALMYCGRAHFTLNAMEKNLARGILYMACAVAIIGQFVSGGHRDFIPGLLDSAHIEEFNIVPKVVFQLALFVLFAFIVFFCREQLRHRQRSEALVPLPAVLTMAVGIAAVVLSQTVSTSFWLFIPAFFHGSQYLAVVLFYRCRQSMSEGSNLVSEAAGPESILMILRRSIEKLPLNRHLDWPRLEYLGSELHWYLLLGLSLSVALPITLSLVVKAVDPFKLVFLLLSLHHFAADSRLWKLRQPAVSRRLIESEIKLAARAWARMAYLLL